MCAKPTKPRPITPQQLQVSSIERPLEVEYVTKQQVCNLLELDTADTHTVITKSVVTTELVSNLEKELEMLQKQAKVQKELLCKNKQPEAVDLQHELEQAGAWVVYADEQRVQAYRHKAGQLDAHSLEEIESLRI